MIKIKSLTELRVRAGFASLVKLMTIIVSACIFALMSDISIWIFTKQLGYEWYISFIYRSFDPMEIILFCIFFVDYAERLKILKFGIDDKKGD